MLEVCVDTIEGARAAVKGGAGRIELCAALSEGGLTPSVGLMQAGADLPVPCYAMIRPRSGLFVFSEREVQIMARDIDAARSAGLAGVVLGVQTADTGELDVPVLTALTKTAAGLGTTLHRVIDVVPDPLMALEQAIALGFDRILTSGAAPFAPDGIELIARMIELSRGRIAIMPGCGLTPENVGDVLRRTGAIEAHAACNRPVAGDPAFSDFDPPGGRYETSNAEVRAMVAKIELALGT